MDDRQAIGRPGAHFSYIGKGFTMSLVDYLKEHGPRSAKDICQHFGWRDTRTLRKEVVDLRKAGVPICATPTKGYWYSENAEDIGETITSLRGRVVKLFAVVRGLEKSASLHGQGSLDFGDTMTELRRIDRQSQE